VTLRGPGLREAPFDMLREWLDESFRAVAPKTLVARLDAGEAVDGGRAKGEPSAKRAASPSRARAKTSQGERRRASAKTKPR